MAGCSASPSPPGRPMSSQAARLTVGDTVLSGGTEIVSSGGTISNSTVSSGGVAELFGGATASVGNTILAGGTLEIDSGYTISGFTVSGGVALEILSGGKTDDVYRFSTRVARSFLPAAVIAARRSLAATRLCSRAARSVRR